MPRLDTFISPPLVMMHGNLVLFTLTHRFSKSLPRIALQYHGIPGGESYLQLATIPLDLYWYWPSSFFASSSKLLDIIMFSSRKRLITKAASRIFNIRLGVSTESLKITFVLQQFFKCFLTTYIDSSYIYHFFDWLFPFLRRNEVIDRSLFINAVVFFSVQHHSEAIPSRDEVINIFYTEPALPRTMLRIPYPFDAAHVETKGTFNDAPSPY